MGAGYKVECNKCGYAKTFFLGSGMMFPSVYESVIADIQNGKYGEEWRDYVASTPGTVVSAEKELYQCAHCNNLVQDYNLSLYVSKDGSAPEHGYWAPWCDHEGYRFIKSFVHRCPRCKARMRKTEIGRFLSIPCPECGSDLLIEDSILWD